MRSIVLLMAACVAVSAGCAGTEATVRARSISGFGGEHTYALADAAPDEAGREDDRRYGSEVARRLTALGYAAAPSHVARYRIALSHDTHPASIALIDARCAGSEPCGAPTPLRASGFVWPGAKTYVHTLTLRWFDCVDGREAYAVSATQRDREPHADRAIGSLVAAALARVPFVSGGPDDDAAFEAGQVRSEWKVKLSDDATDTSPRVTGVAAVLPP